MGLSAAVVNSLRPRHAFVVSGVAFVLLGFLLFDTHLIFAGNIIFALGVLSKIASVKELPAYALFISGLIVSLRLPSLGILLELVSLALWAQSRLLSLFFSPKRLLSSLLADSGPQGK